MSVNEAEQSLFLCRNCAYYGIRSLYMMHADVNLDHTHFNMLAMSIANMSASKRCKGVFRDKFASSVCICVCVYVRGLKLEKDRGKLPLFADEITRSPD